jgi:hypothetical protein
MIELTDPNDPTQTVVGPQFYNDVALDTGANGILLANLAYFDANTFDINPDLYTRQTRADGSTVHYFESGVGGSQPFDLLQPYHMTLTPGNMLNGQTGMAVTLSSVRAFGSSAVDLGSFAGVAGMPVMAGRVTSIDLKQMATDNYFMGVDFHDATNPAPPATANSYHVNMRYLPVQYSAPEQVGDPKPTFTGLPVVDGVTMRWAGQAITASLVLDTGAQISLISESLARRLGIDPERDAIDHLDMGGVGGTVTVPVVQVHCLKIPTREGAWITLTEVAAAVLDIGDGFDGVLGMHLWTGGYTDLIGANTGEYGEFGAMVLDFTDPTTGVLRLDVNPLYDRIVGTGSLKMGDINGDGKTDQYDLGTLAMNMGRPGEWATGDLNGDGVVDVLDLALLARNYVETPPPPDGGGLVPEPASLAVLLGLLPLAVGRGRRERAARRAA